VNCRIPFRRKVLRWTVGLVLLLVLTAGGLLLSKDALLRSFAERRIREQTGLETRIGLLKLGLTCSSLAIRDCKIFNPPEFGGTCLIDLPEVYIELDSVRSTSEKFRFKEVRLHLAEVRLVRNKDGSTNLGYLEKLSRWANRTNGLDFGGIEKLRLTLGTVHYTDLQQPFNSQAFDLAITGEEVTGLETAHDVTKWLAALGVRITLREILSSGVARFRALERIWEGMRQAR
jgi:hypothetical protein